MCHKLVALVSSKSFWLWLCVKSGCRMICQVICRYTSVFCTLSFVARCCRGLPKPRKGSFPFSSISLVNWMSTLFVKVVMKSVNFVFVNDGKSAVNEAQPERYRLSASCESVLRMSSQYHLTLKMTSAQVVETSVTNYSSCQNYPHRTIILTNIIRKGSLTNYSLSS